jgi:hypothetical protein
MRLLRFFALAVLAPVVFLLSLEVTAATPTPTATPTQTPTSDSAVFTFVNNTGQVLNGLEIQALSGGASLEQNAPGCPVPAVSWFPPGGGRVTWSSLCVDPGETVQLRIFNDCFNCGAPSIIAYVWTINGTPLTITPTPPVTITPTPLQGTLATLVNNTGVAASDLHFYLIEAAMTVTVQVVTNAPGCSSPVVSFGGGGDGPDFTMAINVVWSSACVDPGESVTVSLLCSSPQSPAPCVGSVLNQCGDWTLLGSIIGTPCPTPDCGGVPCCNHVPCPPLPPSPTPTPSPTPALVGGILELPAGRPGPAAESGSSGGDTVAVALAAGSAAALLAAIAAGGWWARRRE